MPALLPPTPARILLADCDQMFVAVARRVDPEGAGQARLLVVGGHAKSRGVVCSASYEVRAFGVHAGMPIARAARLCPQATFVPVPGKACGVMHREIRKILEEWAPVVEPASIDEFYLDLSGTEGIYRGERLAETARRLRQAVQDRTGLTLSIGGGSNRLVAKLAAERAKPRPNTGGTGVLTIEPGGEAEFLAGHALAEIPGVGPKLQLTLQRYGLLQVREALRIDQKTFERWLGPGTGRWLYARIRGRGSDAVSSDPGNKSVSHEETFAKDLQTDDAIETRLLRLVTSLASELRGDGLATRRVTVKLRDHDFRTRQAGRTLAEPLSTNRALFAVARELLATLRRRRRTAARLVGVSFSMLDPRAVPTQLDLLPLPRSRGETAKDRRLALAVDSITERLGNQAIRPARLLPPMP